MTTYADSGVHLGDARAITDRLAAIAARTRGASVLADVGAFGGMFSLGAWGQLKEPVLVASTDGVGTKVMVAAALGRYDTLGHDLVNHCLNDIAVQGARPLFFLDYLALHRADPDVVTALVGGVAEACRLAGCALLGGETAEMPDVYAPGGFDIAGFVVGIVDRAEIGRNGEPEVEDFLVGLPSSGLHTNGYSLARRALPPVTWDRYEPSLGTTVGEALLAPHRSYLDEIRSLTDAGARAFAHITGGGIPENLPRVLSPTVAAVIHRHSWEPPAIFRLIAEAGAVAGDEMERVFNVGIGLVAVVPSDRLDAVLAAVPEGQPIGRLVERQSDERLRFVGEHAGRGTG
ncbi:MAG: Phosphoribosylformylglycinamidine cyclo-ligase [uncultured Thermomicrobiales bacterium]|uniref:Phosphoribosylformylglycinamidine cyclo-ligase n=1 Tax=uncultured Thermomicrobiales bacterium TaxID=1645740 RepID=A0A6J4V3C8_9BACT|nr:MAG: Phosphoribosylformylglycinamidine cyclo-ligase [uncultured Thermomicrobiales bacterium]